MVLDTDQCRVIDKISIFVKFEEASIKEYELEDESLLQGIERELGGGGDEFFKVAEEGNAGECRCRGEGACMHSVHCTLTCK